MPAAALLPTFDEESEAALRDLESIPPVPGVNCPLPGSPAQVAVPAVSASAASQLDWDAAALQAMRQVEVQVGAAPPQPCPPGPVAPAVVLAGARGSDTPGGDLLAQVPAPGDGVHPMPAAAPKAARQCKGYRRLQGKQGKPQAMMTADELAMETVLKQALAAEGPAEPALCATTVRRQHVHYTWVRTHDPSMVQPSQYTRKQFYEHLEKVYKEVYPDAGNVTGSIVSFGLCADEEHKQSAIDYNRHLHKHCALFTTTQHYWNKIAKLSLSKYKIPLNAVAHDTYATMFAYLRAPTAKKPLPEIDAEPYMSKYHPRGQALVDLLAASTKSGAANRQRLAGLGDGKRKRLNMFEEIKGNKLKSVDELMAHAAKEADEGRNGLADYCSRQGDKLEGVVANAWKVLNAPARVQMGSVSLVEKLGKASENLPCTCGGRWAPGAVKILERNQISVKGFSMTVLRALRMGAVRGANVACVGEGGCGKSSLLEPFEHIFDCAGKPERGSTFPLASCADHEVLLWQDYEHDEATVRFSDLLSFFLGESVGVRRPGALNTKLRNRAPCFYSGRSHMKLLPSLRHSRPECEEYNEMMAERFATFRFFAPIPWAERVMDFPSCGRCAAKFYILHGSDAAGVVAPLSAPVGGAPSPQLSGAAAAQHGSTMVKELESLAQLHSSGALSPEEFQAAKRQCLCLRACGAPSVVR